MKVAKPSNPAMLRRATPQRFLSPSRDCRFSILNSQFSIRYSLFAIRHSAFTLVEIVVVVAIILILVGMVVPTVSTVWEERKAAEAETMVDGNLITARAAAQLSGKRRGLFFMVGNDGVQRMFPIEAEPFDPANPDDGSASEEAAANRFRIADDNEVALPAPYRVAPRAVVDDGADDDFYWSEAEIVRTVFEYDEAGYDQFERHRNFFAIVFSDNGRLLVHENVLIHDPDDDGDPRSLGDRTGLAVADVDNWLTPASAPLSASGGTLTDMICEGSDNAAINFPSVDGLLVYDDAAFGEQVTGPQKRQYLLDYGQPLYLVRLTGQVIRGPKGGNE